MRTQSLSYISDITIIFLISIFSTYHKASCLDKHYPNFIWFLFCLPLDFYFVFVSLSFLFDCWVWTGTLDYFQLLKIRTQHFYSFKVWLASTSVLFRLCKSSFHHFVKSILSLAIGWNFHRVYRHQLQWSSTFQYIISNSLRVFKISSNLYCHNIFSEFHSPTHISLF